MRPAAAADKAIAADPTKADAYYIKGQALIPKATVDPKTQKIIAPPGCVEAYQKYLELAPKGPHAEEVKEILAGIGEQMKSTYKARQEVKQQNNVRSPGLRAWGFLLECLGSGFVRGFEEGDAGDPDAER